MQRSDTQSDWFRGSRWCRSCRFAQEAAQHEPDIRRAFAEPPHEIGKPFASEGNVDAHPVAVPDEERLQIAPDAVEHLELEAIGTDAVLGRPLPRQIDHYGIVRPDR